MVEIEIARKAGVCYGVERALCIAQQAAKTADGGSVSTLGPLIHNPIVVDELSRQGVTAVGRVADAPKGALVIRAHGVAPASIEQARDLGLTVVDATCPYVKKVHDAARRLVADGFQVLVVGEQGHPEVDGIVGHAGQAQVVAMPKDLDDIPLSARVGVVVQTTQTPEALSAIVAALTPRVRELRVVNTICRATQERQGSARELASRADVMLVVGGRNSGNTRRLAEICAEACRSCHLIESADEVDAAWFDHAHLIGITAGASTPASHIDEVRRAVRSLT